MAKLIRGTKTISDKVESLQLIENGNGVTILYVACADGSKFSICVLSELKLANAGRSVDITTRVTEHYSEDPDRNVL